ncbi:MAG: LTA synthase family protein [Eubacteriales bacterium]
MISPTTNMTQWHCNPKERQLWVFLVHSLFGVYLSVVSLWFGSVSGGWEGTFTSLLLDVPLVILNSLPPLLLLWFFTWLSNSPWIGYLGTAIFTAVVGLVNYYKMVFRGDPFFFADFSLTGEALKIVKEYDFVFSASVVFFIFLLFWGLAMVTRILPLFFGNFFPLATRIMGFCSMTLLIPILFYTLYSNKNLYEHWNQVEENVFISRSERYQSRGLWYSFLYVNRNATLNLNSTEEIEEYYASILEETGPTIPLGEISVVGIMLEGFCDYSHFPILSEEEGVLDVYQIWHDWEKESISGDIVNTVFGGGTATTEWSFLTGIPSPETIPYAIDTYVREFKEAGYYTHGGHPGFQSFYNRINTNQYIGFDKYVYYEDYYSEYLHSDYVYWKSDDVLVDSILAHREEAQILDKPIFSFYVTIQNHGPYSVSQEMSDPYVSAETGIDDEVRAILQSYFNGISKTLVELERMKEAFQETDEPIVVVLFGDHMPWGGNNNEILKAIYSGVIDYNDIAWMTAYYTTPYLIWANDAAREIVLGDYIGDGGTISNHFLMNKVFEMTGWQQSDTMKISSAVMAEIPVVFKSYEYVYFWENEVVSTLPEEYDMLMSLYFSTFNDRYNTQLTIPQVVVPSLVPN